KANSSGVDRSAIGAYIQDIRIVRRRFKKCEILVEMVALNCGGDGEDDDAGGAMASG
ncbi:hypothetical protein Goari_020550, partial [Gossypium aridum]|nr:hypothetical protein [Gossypium aridum]